MKDHDEFVLTVAKHLRENNWCVPPSLAYHDVFDDHLSVMLNARNDPTSMSIRGASDLIAWANDLPLSVRVEVKTVGERHHNFAAAVWPLAEHLYRARMGCHCIYAVRNLSDGFEYGFRVDDDLVDSIARVFVPGGYDDAALDRLRAATSPAMGDRVQFVKAPVSTRGSGTPYVLIPDVEVRMFDDWRTEFDRLKRRSARV